MLQTAETDNPFRAVSSFGPLAAIVRYGPNPFPVNLRAQLKTQTLVRSPIYWTASISNGVFVVEGAGPDGNVEVLRLIKQHNKSPCLQFIEVKGKNHFSAIKTATDIITGKILHDTDPSQPFCLTEHDFQRYGSAGHAGTALARPMRQRKATPSWPTSSGIKPAALPAPNMALSRSPGAGQAPLR